MIGNISIPFEMEDISIGIYNTSQLIKLVSIMDKELIINVEKERVKSFSNESIKEVARQPLYYSIDFYNGGSAYLNRETLNLIYFNASMSRAALGGYYGNSRESGADYKCRLVNKKI